MNKAIYRGIGSIDFTAAFRSVLLAGCDPEDANNLAIVHIKSNLAKKGPAQGYQLKDDNFYWTGESTLTQSQILSGDDSSGSVTELAESIAFLKEELADGALSQRNVYQDAKAVGISDRTLNRSKAQLGVISRHLGEKGKRGGGDWTWELPDGNIDIATKLSGNLNNSEAKKLTVSKTLATSIRENKVPADDPAEPPGLVAPPKDIIKHWNRAGCPPDWQGHGTHNDCLDDLMRDTNCPQHIKDMAYKWHITNGGNKVVQANE